MRVERARTELRRTLLPLLVVFPGESPPAGRFPSGAGGAYGMAGSFPRGCRGAGRLDRPLTLHFVAAGLHSVVAAADEVFAGAPSGGRVLAGLLECLAAGALSPRSAVLGRAGARLGWGWFAFRFPCTLLAVAVAGGASPRRRSCRDPLPEWAGCFSDGSAGAARRPLRGLRRTDAMFHVGGVACPGARWVASGLRTTCSGGARRAAAVWFTAPRFCCAAGRRARRESSSGGCGVRAASGRRSLWVAAVSAWRSLRCGCHAASVIACGGGLSPLGGRRCRGFLPTAGGGCCGLLQYRFAGHDRFGSFQEHRGGRLGEPDEPRAAGAGNLSRVALLRIGLAELVSGDDFGSRELNPNSRAGV